MKQTVKLAEPHPQAKNYSPSLDAASDSRNIHRLSRFLDSSIPLPGGFKIGFDGIIGLIPGIGDAFGGLLSSLIVYQAYQRKVPKLILIRMVINIAIDSAVGSIPILGDVFDFFWKANLKNARLIEEYDYAPQKTYRKSAAAATFIIAATVLFALLVVYVTLMAMRYAWSFITSA